MDSSADVEVLIAGAGPTGLVLALWLARMGVRVRIVDKTAGPGTTSRALAVQARTLEFYQQLGFAQEVVDAGRHVGAVNLWVRGRHAARAEFGELGKGVSPFPFALVYPQDEHERLLIGKLAELGVTVERRTELVSFEERAEGVSHPSERRTLAGGPGVAARLRMADGTEESVSARYLAGCDGARSTVRQALKIGFPGGEYSHLFYVADVEASGPVANGELHVGLDRADFLAVFPLRDKSQTSDKPQTSGAEGRLRLVGTVREEQAERTRDELAWEDVSHKVIEWMSVDVRRVNWFSTYRVHHRVAERFRQGRVFLLGDAAHIHSPVGGQGMNTGIGDAVNLAWKLAGVVRGRAAAGILETYEPERIAFARRLVTTTDKAFTAVTSESGGARLLRLQILPRLLPALFSVQAARRFLFRAVSQTGIEYRESALSEGRAGAVHGGDRLPWVRLADGADNFVPLRSLGWQAHVYGTSECPDVRRLARERSLPLHVFAWQPEFAAAGLVENAMYLVRPDGYVALADHEAKARRLAEYIDRQGLRFPA